MLPDGLMAAPFISLANEPPAAVNLTGPEGTLARLRVKLPLPLLVAVASAAPLFDPSLVLTA
jgi:hypothetical protein